MSRFRVLRFLAPAAMFLAFGGCRLDGNPESEPRPPIDPSEDDVVPAGEPAEPTPAPLPCEGGTYQQIQLTDLWGRPLPEATAVQSSDPGELAYECFPTAWLQCGATISGDTSDPNSGHTTVIADWPGTVGNYAGPELSFAFRAPVSGPITWALVDPRPTEQNHDLFVLADDNDRCERGDTIARGFNDVSFEAEAGRTYFLVLDSFAGEAGPFEVRLDCGGAAGGSGGPLEQPAAGDGAIEVTYGAPDYLPTTLTTTVIDGRFRDIEVTGSARWALSNDVRPVPGEQYSCHVETLYVGLDHAFYATSTARPPRDGNHLAMMHSGEDLFAAIHEDLLSAVSDVHIATWWWESNMELVRPENHATMTESQREPYTVMSVLESMPSVDKKVMVSRFCDDSCFGALDWMTTDDALEDKAETAGDAFEVALQGNPTDVPLFGEFDPPPIVWSFTDRLAADPAWAGRRFVDDGLGTGARFGAPIASYHQKMMTIDGEVAFVGGMNIKATDWDTEEHLVFDPRRMNFEADLEDRQEVVDKEERPDNAPRKDYAVRVEGPLARDVDEVLHLRWQQTILDDEPWAEGNTVWSLPPLPEERPGGRTAQFQTTLPEPYPERSILESLDKAIRQAQRYIYIEDQYWRVPVLNEALLQTLKARPKVKLVVVTMPVSKLDPAAEWTGRVDRLFREQVPDQYVTFTTKSFDWAAEEGWFGGWDVEPHLVGHSLHSKLTIIDDRYLSVGSANKNNRGLLYEGEANVAILDDRWVRDRRIEVMDQLLGPDFASRQTDDFAETWDLLREAADHNEAVVEWWDEHHDDLEPAEAASAWNQHRPSGFLYRLKLPEDGLVSPGPDAF